MYVFTPITDILLHIFIWLNWTPIDELRFSAAFHHCIYDQDSKQAGSTYLRGGHVCSSNHDILPMAEMHQIMN